jgi:hypothetical protein
MELFYENLHKNIRSDRNISKGTSIDIILHIYFAFNGMS